MNKIANLLRLEFITIKPYLTFKNMSIYLFMITLFIFIYKSPITIISMILMLATTYNAYPFAVADQNGLDALYTIVGLKRQDVVKGRYAYMMVINIIGVLIALIVSTVISYFFLNKFDIFEIFQMIIPFFFIMMLVQLIQYPMFFKLGYMKARSLVYLAYVIIIAIGALLFGIVTLIANLKSSSALNVIVETIDQKPIMIVFVLMACLSICFLFSKRLSMKYYLQREF